MNSDLESRFELLQQNHLLTLSEADLDELIEADRAELVSAFLAPDYTGSVKYAVWLPSAFLRIGFSDHHVLVADQTIEAKDLKHAAELARQIYHSANQPAVLVRFDSECKAHLIESKAG